MKTLTIFALLCLAVLTVNGQESAPAEQAQEPQAELESQPAQAEQPEQPIAAEPEVAGDTSANEAPVDQSENSEAEAPANEEQAEGGNSGDATTEANGNEGQTSQEGESSENEVNNETENGNEAPEATTQAEKEQNEQTTTEGCENEEENEVVPTTTAAPNPCGDENAEIPANKPCQKSCKDVAKNKNCSRVKVNKQGKCYCKEGFAYDKNTRKCVAVADCPPSCSKNEKRTYYIPQCQTCEEYRAKCGECERGDLEVVNEEKACYCREGWVHSKEGGGCVPALVCKYINGWTL